MTDKKSNATMFAVLFCSIQDLIASRPDMDLVHPERRDAMALSLAEWVTEAIEKYYKGQAAHGGDIIDRDLAKEIQQEQIDLYWYTAARSWKESEK